MIHDLDRTLEKLVREKVPLPADQYDLSFRVPSERWEGGLTRTTANLYLYDVRENLDLRDGRWVESRPDEAGFTRERRQVRIDAYYAVTAWASAADPDVIEEHRLLADLLRTFLRFTTLPREVLVGSLAGLEPPLPTMIAQLDGLPQPAAEFWTSLGNRLRPAISVVVTIALRPAAHLDAPRRTPAATSGSVEVGLADGTTMRATVRPPSGPAAAGAAVARLSAAPEPAARLSAATFGDATILAVANAAKLRSDTLILVDDGNTSEIVRLGPVPGAGSAEIPVSPPLRAPHDAGRPLRSVSQPAGWNGMLARAVEPGATTIQLSTAAGITPGAWILIEDPDGSEAARIESAEDDIELASAIREPRRAGAFVRVLSVDSAVATTLAEPVARPATRFDVDAADRFAAGDMLMLDSGTIVEFVRVNAVGPRSVDVDPPARRNHAPGAPLRQLMPGRRLGELVVAAEPDAVELMIGVRAGEREPGAGDILQLEGAPVAVQVESAAPAPGGVPGAAGQTVGIGGRVQDDGEPPAPVGGARVTLHEHDDGGRRRLRETIADNKGRYRFSAARSGAYSLDAVAVGFAPVTKDVSIPPSSPDEYVLTVPR